MMAGDETTGVRQMLKLEEVLARVNVGRTTLHEWIDAGTFPASVKIGPKAVRWFADDVLAWQTKQKPFGEKRLKRKRGEPEE